MRVFHRGVWFYLADDDLDSKTTFNLLSFLVSLQSGEAQGQTPLLAIGN